jgi:hypothetical protein
MGSCKLTLSVALTRFKRILPYVRSFVRELTHTLQLPPAHAEIYGGPHAEWLRDCLEYLPRLQCLLVNGLPFFDHASLLSLRHASLRRSSNRPHIYPVFGLRLLDASGCTNATSTGLAEALCHFPNLVSLDLSQTPAARDNVVLGRLRCLSSLRLLSLKGLGLRDADMDIIAPSIGTRVRSLDVGNNHLSDASARALLAHCLKEEPVEARASMGPLPPVQDERDDNGLATFESENVAGHVRRKLTGGFVGSLAIEMARDVGITHLYLSKNVITVEGISGLLRSRRLQVLDIGILPVVLERPYLDAASDGTDDIELPSVAKLTPVISTYAATKLKYLRVNHKIITEDAPIDATVSPRAELGGDIGRYASSDAHELEAVELPRLELDDVDTSVHEFPGDSTYPVELQGCSPKSYEQTESLSKPRLPFGSQRTSARFPNIEVTVEKEDVDQRSKFAPEPVFIDSHTPASPLQDHYSQGVVSDSLSNNGASFLSPREHGTGTTSNMSRQNSTHYVEDRRARLELRQSQENRLHPGMLSKVHTIVLTEVPVSTNNGEVIRRMIQYIKDAAEEASIARQRAKHTYVLPPGRSRALAEREHAYSIFALKRIVLEMAPPPPVIKKLSTDWRAYPTKSSTEDADSEAFWEAATQDFSFFGEEECGLPGSEPGRTLPLEAMSGLQLAPQRPLAPEKSTKDSHPRALLDVVGEIAKFRKERKAAYQNLVQRGKADLDVEGYWPGDVTIVRKAPTEAGELDCYGNRYESGWYYR